MRRFGPLRRIRRGVLVALALAGALAACARTAPAPVVYGDRPAPNSAPGLAAGGVAGPARHMVAKGDTIYSVAQQYGVPLRAVIDANRLSPPYGIVIGQMLVLPSPRAHKVARGDTLYGISRAYNVDVASLVRANRLSPPYVLHVGRSLVLPAPGATDTAVAQAADSARDDNVPYPRLKPSPAQAKAVAAASPPAEPPPRAGSRFAWPVRGRILSRYGAKPGGLHNDGVNIAVSHGEPVRAAENGIVVYAGNELKGFGNLVLIRHHGGWVSAYAHNEELLVRKGTAVKRGETIARAGASGSVDKPQLHFELRRGARTVDPLRYLDTRQAGLPSPARDG